MRLDDEDDGQFGAEDSALSEEGGISKQDFRVKPTKNIRSIFGKRPCKAKGATEGENLETLPKEV